MCRGPRGLVLTIGHPLHIPGGCAPPPFSVTLVQAHLLAQAPSKNALEPTMVPMLPWPFQTAILFINNFLMRLSRLEPASKRSEGIQDKKRFLPQMSYGLLADRHAAVLQGEK